MATRTCKHTWSMADVRYGFVVTEKCYHCAELSGCVVGATRSAY